VLNRANGPPVLGFGGLRTTAQSAGDRVRAFRAEMATAAEIVTANWR
jgi:hypothetical protein